jgi:hypothetical protein
MIFKLKQNDFTSHEIFRFVDLEGGVFITLMRDFGRVNSLLELCPQGEWVWSFKNENKSFKSQDMKMFCGLRKCHL